MLMFPLDELRLLALLLLLKLFLELGRFTSMAAFAV